MINQLLSSNNLQAVPRIRGTPTNESIKANRMGRLIPMSLAIYLIPVLLVVVVISGIGMMILGISDTVHGRNGWVKRTTPGNGKPSFYR
jgi:hypothetical protein